MSQILFGAGNMQITQLLDANGNTISNPTPYPLLVMQEGAIEESADMKELYGQGGRAFAVARGKIKTTIKVKNARVLANVWNAVYYGQTLTSGIISGYNDTTGSAIPATPFQVTVTPPNSGTHVDTLGVIDSNGNPMTRVASAPATGQYSVVVGTGVYTFAAADTLKTVYINYQYTSATAGIGYKQTVRNLNMGSAPTFRARLTVAFQGKMIHIDARNCVCNKLSLPFKNEDFAVPELNFTLQDDGAGNVYDWSTSE